MTWSDGGIRPSHPDIIPADKDFGGANSANGVLIIGEKGLITTNINDSSPMMPKLFLNDGTTDFGPETGSTEEPEYGHQRKWVDACKAGFGSKEHKALTSSFDYAGPMTDRVWLTDRSGEKNRRLYQRENNMQWVTHEVWVPGRRTVAFVDWPRGMRMIDVDRSVVRQITYSPAWHAAPDDAGERFVCDTNFPDRGLHTFELDADPADDAEFLCASEASSEGKHWGGPFPYNDGPVAVEAAQHTHPHPRFSPDGSRVVFTSDKTGHAQLYEVMLDDE